MKQIIKHNHYASLYFSVVWMIISLIAYGWISDKSVTSHNILTWLNLCSYILCIYNWLKCGGRLLSLYVFFVTYTSLSNLGQPLLFSFGALQELLPLYTLVDFGGVVKALRFQCLCSAALNLGTVCYVYKASRLTSLGEQRQAYIALPQHPKNRSWLDILLFACLSYILFMCLTMLTLRQTLGYADFFEMGRGEQQGIIVQLIKMGALVLPLWALYTKRHTNIVAGFLLSFIVLLMLVGSRGLAIRYVGVLLVTTPIVYPQYFKKRYWIIWTFVAFVGFSFLSIISANRTSNLSGDSFATEESLQFNALSTVSEMGMSAHPLVATIETNEGGTPHYQTILVSLIRALVPISSELEIVQSQNVHLADWVTEYVGSFSRGLGYSCIAEVYMNYGWFGWIFMFVYGYFIAYAECTAYRNIVKGKYLYAVVLLSILCVQIVWARGQFSDYVGTWRDAIYILILGLLFKSYKKNKYAIR